MAGPPVGGGLGAGCGPGALSEAPRPALRMDSQGRWRVTEPLPPMPPEPAVRATQAESGLVHGCTLDGVRLPLRASPAVPMRPLPRSLRRRGDPRT